MILGGLWISIKPNMFSIGKVHYTFFPMIAGIVVMWLLGFMNISSYMSAGIFAISGMAIMLSLALSNVLTLTYIQKQTPENMLGSVSAFSTAMATISIGPGQLIFGQFIESGIPIRIIFFITLIANCGLIIFIKSNIRNINN